MSTYGCWVTGCASHADVQVTNPWVPLVSPLESCNAHVGDLLGNAAKAALRVEGAEQVTLMVTALL